MSQYEDKHFKCAWKEGDVVCSAPFVWTARDQEFYAEHQYTPPRYCGPHRAARKARFEAKRAGQQ